jgi:enterochelin esterase-like enzyme
VNVTPDAVLAADDAACARQQTRSMSASSIANRIPTLPRVAVVATLATALAIGLAAVYGYIDQYVRYRGFGPPISHVAASSQGRIVSFTFASSALAGRIEKPLVYLPAGYASHPATRYPVLYLLHGTPGDPRTAFVNSLHLGPRMDTLAAGHRIRPMLVVMPPGSSSTYDHATEWANGPGAGASWFRYLTHDLVRAVDSRYRTIPTRSGRAIAGYSSGADAAVNAILWHPGTYAVAEAWSGDFRQTPRSVGRIRALVTRFSALQTAPRLAAGVQRAGDHVYLYAGRHDRVLPMTMSVAQDLQRAHVRTRLDVTGGGHAWELWASRMDGALRYASDHLAVPR